MDGSWSEWDSWTQCTKSCGHGMMSRERACTNPSPIGSGEPCKGESKENQSCNEDTCLGKILQCG